MELIGRRFGHIRVTDVVGQGGMGDVYAAYDEKLERKVALKVLNADQRLDDEARERLLREARALSRLDHAHICRIYDYIENEDVDLLVLEFIDGRTLYDAETEKMTRREKLRIAAAIAEVLITAHRAGIVHRDLKPENVMLTTTGEVKVLDFGLARWLNRTRVKSSDRVKVASTGGAPEGIASDTLVLLPAGESGGSSEGGRREFLATAVGITLGTPLYMSPEQARGDTLTPASDMFSFGLLLQWLFTGQEPHPYGLSARDVIMRVARGETLPVQNGAGDVTSFIQRLKALAPTDRPTAVEAAERLKFLQEKPQRILRRSVAAALLAIALIGGWRYTVDLQRERARAEAARADADRRRAQAEGLIEFMLGDLRKKLEKVGRLDALDGVAERTLAYAGSADPQSMSVDELVHQSKALNQLGDVRIGLGKLDEAMTIFQRSRTLAEVGAKREPQSAPAQLAVATAHFWIGDVLRQQGKLDEALPHLAAYMTGAEKLARAYPASDEYKTERAYGHSSVAWIHERNGDLPRALQHLQVARQIQSALAIAKPQDTDRQADLARTLNRTGSVLQRSGDLRGARALFAEEYATWSRLVQKDNANAFWKERLITSESFLATVLENTGDVRRALQIVTEMVRLNEELTRLDPENTQWQRDLAIARMRHANALRLNGELAEAANSADVAIRTMRPLLQRENAVWSWRRDMAVIHTAAARVHLARGNTATSLQSIDAAMKEFSTITQTDTTTPRYVADTHIVAGDAHRRAGNAARAKASWTKAVETLAAVAAKTDNPATLDVFARGLLRLNRGAEADPVIGKLNAIGYRAPDFVSALAERELEKRGAS